jgi:glycine cleavage system H lipoate-binding protein
MSAETLFSPHETKALEYAVAVAYLLLFVPFWRFVTGGARRVERAPAFRGDWADWFRLPPGEVHLHPGHAWLRPQEDGVVRVGLDDFTQKLLGPIRRLLPPPVGATLSQGEPAWTVAFDGHAVDMLSPLDGTVVEVNEFALRDPARVNASPYEDGWLLKVRPSRWSANAKQLLHGRAARKWMEAVAEGLTARMHGEAGLVLQDGGQPVAGLALALDPDHPDEAARAFLLS